MKVKICGMRDEQNISDILTLQPDYLGFIFYEKSKRFLDRNELDIAQISDVKKVGVFVNATISEIKETIRVCSLDVVQLHGDESVELCNTLNQEVEVWKAFGVDEQFDWKLLKDYEKSCSHFLLDTKTITYGGSGRKFNWELLQQYKLAHPLILSGGLNVGLLEEAMALSEQLPIDILDINSGIEIEPGLKNIEQARLAIGKIRNYELSS